MTKRTQMFFFSAATLVVLLMVNPATGWLVRQQLHVIGGGSLPVLPSAETEPGVESRTARDAAVAATAHPNDFDLQVASKVEIPTDILRGETDGSLTPTAPGPDGLRGTAIRGLLTLRAPFNDRPALQAHILRYLTQADLKINRNDGDIFLSPAERDYRVDCRKRDLSRTTAAIDLAKQTALRGEMLDPGNAFFPTMFALALLSEHKDADAIAAMNRAAGKPRWDDYMADETRGRIALLKAMAGGETGAISTLAIVESAPFPHLDALRDMARVMTALAVRREIDGDVEGGLAIRRSLARIGATMRVQSRSIVGSLVGVDITGISSWHPGGEPDDAIIGRGRDAALDARYVAYLTQSGHMDDATWYAAERRAGVKVRSVARAASDQTVGMLPRPLICCLVWLAAGTLALLSAVLMLVLGGSAALFARTRHVRRSLPLHRGVYGGLLLLTLCPVYYCCFDFLFGGVLVDAPDRLYVPIIAGLAAGLSLPVWYMKRGETWGGFAANARICLLTVMAVCGFAAAVLGVGALLEQSISSSMSCPSTRNGDRCGLDLSETAFFGSLALIAPLILTLTLAIRSRKRRLPVSVSVARGFRSFAVPVSGMLLLLYAASIVGGAIQDATARRQIDAMLTHEGQYEAATVHLQWPGTVGAPFVRGLQ